MVVWIAPQYSKTRVRKAGNAIRDNKSTLDDHQVLENWRACHSYILNTFQANLRNRSRGTNITVAQRLKRRVTIIDKLQREPHMQLSTMQDIAGCRVIFSNEEQLLDFRKSMHLARFKHDLKNKENDRYNYIMNPKTSGYRGIHDIYEYQVSSHQGVAWNGLLIEIQYRTQVQHAWATAVEIADLATFSRIKFSQADNDHQDFFRLASEILARNYENRNSCMNDLNNEDLIAEFLRVDMRLGMMLTFQNLKLSENKVRFRTNMILIFPLQSDSTKGSDLEVETFDSINKAIERYDQLEKDLAGKADIVLVRADNPESIRDAFRNYFSDAIDFVKYLMDGVEELRSKPKLKIYTGC